MSYAGQNLKGLPSRVSPHLVMDLCDRVIPVREVVEFLSTPRFFLPEINAQWILALRGLLSVVIPLARENSGEISETGDRVRVLLDRAEKNFLGVFWNEDSGCLYNLVFEDRSVADRLESEPSVTAGAMLGRSIFPLAKLETIWRTVSKKLLISRNLVRYGKERLPFGIIVKNTDWRIYYDDTQYHSDVIWPRSAPYLVRLLILINDSKTAKEIVLNNLDHQMSEGAIFYNHELFSRPSGNNPGHVEATEQNPVPVKNAIQFWSQWCDPIVELFGPAAGRVEDMTR
jgi:glycogen debranching enzyme